MDINGLIHSTTTETEPSASAWVCARRPDLEERDDGHHEGIIDGFGVVLLQLHPRCADGDVHPAVPTHQGAVEE